MLVKQIMRRDVHTVAADVTLPELERAFVEFQVGGFPVLESGELVGIVSRSDIVRQLVLEHTAAEIPDYYFDDAGFHEVPLTSYKQVADRVGERIEGLRVRDVMSDRLIRIRSDEPVRHLAQLMTDEHVHRVLVTENDQLVGIVSSLDVARLVANGRFRAAE